MRIANFSRVIVVQLRSFAQLAFLEQSMAGCLIIVAIAFISVWSALAAMLGTLINNSLSLIIKDYSKQEWQLGLAGYNGAIVGIFWGATILNFKGLLLFIVALLLCLLIECLLRALLTPRQLPILSLPAMSSILILLNAIWLFSLDPDHVLFLTPAEPLIQEYGWLAAILTVMSTIAYLHPLATLQTIIISLTGGLVGYWITGLNLLSLFDLWAFNLAPAYFSMAALFLKHSQLATVTATFNTILAGLIWYFWSISGLDRLSPPLLLPFIISSLLTLSLLKRFENHYLLQPEFWRALQILLVSRRQNKQCVAIAGSGIHQGALPDYPSGQWLDPNVPFSSYTLAEFKTSQRCRYLYWKASYQLYQQTLAVQKNTINKQLDSLLSGNLSGLFTETIDGLFNTEFHPIFECYGSIKTLYCLDCTRQQPWPSVPLWLNHDLHCPSCAGLLKPQILAADEYIAPKCCQAILQRMTKCDYLLVIGVPTLTPVVAMIIEHANSRKIPIICIGTIPTGYLAMDKDVLLAGDIASWLTPICRILNEYQPLTRAEILLSQLGRRLIIKKRIIATGLKLTLIFAIILTTVQLLLVQLPQRYQENRIWLKNKELLGDNQLSATIMQPEGAGPHPAVVLLHGCFGVSNKHYQWSKQLNEWGYTTLIVDSFSHRGIDQICSADNKVWLQFNQQRPKDALVALEYLQSHRQVNPNNIALIGWSYGGTITLKTIEQRNDVAGNGYKAGIAFYPSCWQFKQYLMSGKDYVANVPLRILMGQDDEWTRPVHCQMLLHSKVRTSKQQLQIYEGAHHNFDDQQQRYQRLKGVRLESTQQSQGDVTVGYNKPAHIAAQSAVRDFLNNNINKQRVK